MLRDEMPVRIVDDTPPHRADVIEVQELPVIGRSPAGTDESFEVFVLRCHIPEGGCYFHARKKR